MAISKELKLGTIAILTVAVMVWGYKFLKGQELFAKGMTLHSVYSDVYQLAVSSPVYINGLKVGNVSKIDVNRENVKEMTVFYYIEGDYGIPTDAVATMISEGVVGGRALSIVYDHNCTTDCVDNGQLLPSRTEGLLESMVSKDEISDYVESFKDALGDPDTSATMTKVVNNLESTINNLSLITSNLNTLLEQSSHNLSKTIANTARITKTIADNEAQIAGMLSNLEEVSTQLKNADIGSVVNKADSVLAGADDNMEVLRTTMENSNKAITKLDSLLTKMQEGEGSIAKMMNNPALYDNLSATSSNLSLLLQDLRLNPKRYVNVSVFGKKSKQYVKPEDDPAYEK